MILAQLQIQNLRNIESARFDFHPHLNVIVGANGSGKTSILEAIYLLGSGHSFRTREISPLIRYETDSLTVFARTNDEQSVSIRKSTSSPTVVRLNNYPCQSSSELARFLPCQVFYQDLFQVIDAGPANRRSLLDWGLFHVEQNYHPLWKDYRRALKQRNRLLKQKAVRKYVEPWNLLLDELANKLNHFRARYFANLAVEFEKLLSQLTDLQCNLHYYKGWDRKGTNRSLAAILADSYPLDLQRQYTQYGAHHADLYIEANDRAAKQNLSRGQQKIILVALKIAQTLLMPTPCVFLCDDLSSELDAHHLVRLLSLIEQTRGQFFITLIRPESLPISWDLNQYSLFTI